MTRTITHSEFVNGAGEGVYVSTVHYASRAERAAGDAAVQRVVAAAAFTPFGHAGEAMDPPEPSYRVNTMYRVTYQDYGRIGVEVIPESEWRKPQDPPEEWPSDRTAREYAPNCDGNNSGQVLAHAQHVAAEGGEGCDSAACLITRGND